MKIGLGIGVLVLTCLRLTAQVSFETQVSRSSITTADRIDVSFTLSNARGSQFTPPAMSDFQVLGGPYQSSSFTSVNGKSSQQFSWKYVLQPKKEGTLTIGAATVKAGNESLQTKPVSIQVSKKAGGSNTEQGGGDDLTAFLRNNFYLRAEVSDASVYKGEALYVTYYLYVNARSDILDYRVNGATKVPTFDGFYAEEVDVSHQQGVYKNINGQQFLVQPVKKVKLTPQRPGDLFADPLTIDASLSVRRKKKNSGDPFFDDFFGRGADRLTTSATSPALKIEVKDLPANAPEFFNGAVGQFDMKTSLNTTQTSTDEPITYRIELKGTGNLSLFQAPKLELPPGWETYEPKAESGKGSLTYEYLLIPRNPGTFTIPEHQWAYFDPVEKQYFVLGSESYTIEVEEGASYNQGRQIGAQEDIEILARDIAYISTKSPVTQRFAGINPRSVWFYTTAGLPFLGILLLLLFQNRQRSESEQKAWRDKQAGQMARKRLAKAVYLSKQDQPAAFYRELLEAMWGYMSDRFGIARSDLSKEMISMVLQQNQIPAPEQENTLLLLSQLEMGIYAPGTIQSHSDETLQRVEEWIVQLEKIHK